MKICPNCNNQADDSARFCNNCGSIFPEQAPAQPQYQAPQQPQAPVQPQYQEPAQPQYQAPVQPQYQAPQQPQYQAPVPPQMPAESPKKKMNAGVLVAIIVAALLVVAAGVLLILDATETIDFIDIISSEDKDNEDKDDKDKSDEDKDDEDKKESNAVEKTTAAEETTTEAKETTTEAQEETTEEPPTEAEDEDDMVGVISGKTYTNAWAGVSVKVPSGYTAVDAATREELLASPGITDAFMMESADGTGGFGFIVYDYTGSSVSNEKILESYLSGSLANFDASGVYYEISDYYTMDVGSFTYDCVDVYAEDAAYGKLQSVWAYNLDGNIIMLSFYANTEEEIEILGGSLILP